MRITFTCLAASALLSAFLCLGLSACSFTSAPDHPSAIAVAADDAGIRYTGRVALTHDAALYDWANIQIEFKIQAPEVELLIEDGKNDYNVFVDGALHSTISTSTEHTTYRVELDENPHLVKITKRTGPNFGAGTFRGLRMAKGGKLLSLPPRPLRRIEFIGDSNTIGYGNEGPGLDCAGVYRPYENSYLSAASIAARQLHAEAHLIAISGYGAVRNYGDTNTTSATPVPYFYNRTLMARADLIWDFRQWMPDAVVIKLGTNDFSTQPEPPAAVFLAGIHSLLTQVHTAYGDVVVFLVSDTSLSQTVEYMQIATREQREKGYKNTHFINLTYPPEEQLGCDWHPLAVAHEKFAEELVNAIAPVMGW